MRVGMRRDQRRVADPSDIPKATFIEVGQVDQDTQPVAGTNQFLAEIGKTGTGVG